MRVTPRRRRFITRARLWWLTPLLRYSYSRDAYILRGIGRHVGPVLRVKRPTPAVVAEAGIRRRRRADEVSDPPPTTRASDPTALSHAERSD